MGWLFTGGSTRKDQIKNRSEDWQRTDYDNTLIRSTCLAHCYRGGSFAGVLWTVWERTYQRAGVPVKPAERWIGCDLLRYQTGFGWGYKDMEESMHPYYYSCPLKYLAMVPLEKFGGNAEWRQGVEQHHAQANEKRAARRLAA